MQTSTSTVRSVSLLLKRVAFSIACLFFVSTYSYAESNSYPGGVAELLIDKKTDILHEVRFGLREPTIIDAGTHWRILIGIELNTLPGEYVVYVKRALSESNAYVEHFNVKQRIYPVQETGKESLVDLQHSKFSDLDFSNSAEPRFPLRYPALNSGLWHNNFGHLQVEQASNQLLSSNSISLSTTAIVPVVSPQDAIVAKITTDEQQLHTIYLDHGRGVYSIISGVQDLSVELGNGVVAGAVIARLKGPNADRQVSTLYWQCVMNGVYVDPTILAAI